MKRDIVKMGLKRFANSFLTLQLDGKKKKVQDLHFSDEWGTYMLSKSAKGKSTVTTVLS